MNQPLISIGILCYNAQDTISRAIDCALSQDWNNTEILIVDDYSCDDSAKIIKEYMLSHSNIIYIYHDENKGAAVSRNTVLNNFRGDYLAFFDDDDFSVPSRLTEQYNRLASYREQFALCYCNRKIIHKELKSSNSNIIKGIGWDSPEPYGELAVAHWLQEKSIPPYRWGAAGSGCMMAHKSTFKKIGYFDPQMLRAQDIEYAIQGAFKGCHFISANNTLLHQYITSGKDKKFQRGLQSHLYIVSKYKKYLKNNNIYIYSLILAYAQAHEFCNNKWRFKISRSIAKRILLVTQTFRKLKKIIPTIKKT